MECYRQQGPFRRTHMTQYDLSGLSAVLAAISAALWFYSAASISREKELARRKSNAAKQGVEPDLGGVVIIDDDKRYDLIATLRHQARWSKWGAVFAALALATQAADKYV